MKLKLRDENGYEENMLKEEERPLIVKIVSLAVFVLFFYWFYKSGGLSIFVIVFIIFWLFLNFLGDESVTIDKGLKSVIIEQRWKESKKISFSDVIAVRAFEDWGGDSFSVEIELITKLEVKKIFSLSYSKDAKEIAVRVCKIIGVNGYYIDDKKNSTALSESIVAA